MRALLLVVAALAGCASPPGPPTAREAPIEFYTALEPHDPGPGPQVVLRLVCAAVKRRADVEIGMEFGGRGRPARETRPLVHCTMERAQIEMLASVFREEPSFGKVLWDRTTRVQKGHTLLLAAFSGDRSFRLALRPEFRDGRMHHMAAGLAFSTLERDSGPIETTLRLWGADSGLAFYGFQSWSVTAAPGATHPEFLVLVQALPETRPQ